MPRPALPKWIAQRGNVYYYRRDVPERYLHLVDAPIVRVSLGTSDLAAAVVARDRVNALTEELWRSLARGDTEDPGERYRAAVDRAKLEGFAYTPAADVRDATIGELLKRIAKLEAIAGPSAPDGGEPLPVASGAAADALLGLVDQPRLMVSQLVDEYDRLTPEERLDRTPRQVHRTRLPRLRAVANLVSVVGDKPVAEVSRSDALAFLQWWVDRVAEEGLQRETVNKDIMAISRMMKLCSDRLELKFGRPFGGLYLKADQSKRPPFSTAFIRETLLADGALDNLNADARAVIHVMIETGARPIELVHLRPLDILLDAKIPHIHIRPYRGYSLKTDFSEREIPLVGIAVEGARHLHATVSRYRDNTGSLSALCNKFMGEHGLLESPDHTLYSLRHSFRDRLTDASAPDLMDRKLMGHKPAGEDYGKGPTLERKLEWIRKIAVSL